MSDEKQPLKDPENPSPRAPSASGGEGSGRMYLPEKFDAPYIVSVIQGCLAEFLGLNIFVIIGVGSIMASLEADTDSRLLLIALAHGLTISICIYLFNHISGGHINPAVTFALMLDGRCDVVKAPLFIISQLLGSTCGALFLKAAVPSTYHGGFGTHGLGSGVSTVQGISIEAYLTFLLVLTVFLTAVDSRNGATQTTGMAPWAIGTSVVVEHFVGVRLTGASMNPGRAFGPALISGIWTTHYVFWLGPLIGAFIAWVVYMILTARPVKN